MTRDETREFFQRSIANVPEGMKVLIWTLPDKTSYWQSGIENATNEALKQCDLNADVYVGVGLSNKALGRKARVHNQDVAGLFGLWADIDFKDPTHKKANLPSESEAFDFIQTLTPASMIVHSGHGYQAWWLFD